MNDKSYSRQRGWCSRCEHSRLINNEWWCCSREWIPEPVDGYDTCPVYKERRSPWQDLVKKK